MELILRSGEIFRDYWINRASCDALKSHPQSDCVSGDGAHGRPWDVAGNSLLAMQYGSLYYRPADLSNVTMKLIKCGGKVRHGLCLHNTTDVLEACKPHNRKLRLAQKSDPPAASRGKLNA